MIAATSLVEIAGAAHYIARPSMATTAGVLVIPPIFGLNSFVRGFSDSLAALGYAALAWNPYPGTRDGLTDEAAREQMKLLTDPVCLDQLAKAVDFMKNDLHLSKIGTLGFCLGGRLGLLLAEHDTRIDAVVSIYPSIPGDGVGDASVIEAKSISCPVQLIYPGHDRVTRYETFRALESGLQGRSVETVVLLYPEAHHAFMNRPGVPANDTATRSARPQIDGFLAAHLS